MRRHRSKVAAKTSKSQPDSANADREPGVHADPVEITLLGGMPREQTTTAMKAAFTGSASRLTAVRAFLAEQPELGRDFAKQIDEARRQAKGSREAFTTAIGERRAEIVSRAELHNVQTKAPAAIEEFYRELSRYLADFEGLSLGAR